jgi:3-hydroxymyristoyl/3-hydroxydecanoyl-(acyl carrier protein) dehydratase
VPELVTQPEVVAVHSPTIATRQFVLRIPAELCYFEGHFPGHPLLPGVIQITWAAQFGRQYFALPTQFTHLSLVKFMRVIAPGSRVTLTLEFREARKELSFSYRCGEALCSSGNIGFT